MLVAECSSAHILTMLFLPMFTLNYIGGSLNRRDAKSIELKIKRKIRREEENKKSPDSSPRKQQEA